MGQSYAKLYAHLIFSTKHRKPMLDNRIRPRVHGYLAECVRNRDSSFVVVGGVADHVHILFDMGRLNAAKDLVEHIKRESSKFVKTLGQAHRNFFWQSGYGIFSVSPTHLSTVEAYVRNQEQHHQSKSFKEEFRDFLERYQIKYDEQYLWD